jgi:UDP-glucose 4-epimerase
MNSIRDKKFLVTGGAGFIGSHMVDRLIAEGAEVVVVDNLVTGRKENLNPKVKFYEMNIADPKLKDIFEKERPEIVYHFAFYVLVPKSIENPLLDMDSTVGSVNLLKNCRDFGVKKIVFSSSGFIYGNTPNLPAKETEPMQPVSSYSIAKYTVENYLRFFKNSFDLSYVILRYPAVYGPRQITGAMADYIRKLAAGLQAEMYGDGQKTRDYIYIDDVIRANLMVLDIAADFEEPVFNIGTGIETTLNDLYKKIAEILNRKAEPIYLPDRPGEQVRYCLDYSKIKKVLGWEPKYSLEEGLKLRIKDYVDNL